MVNAGENEKIAETGRICEAITKTLESQEVECQESVLVAMVERTASVAASIADVDDVRLSVTLRDNLARLIMTAVQTECRRMERLARSLKGGKK